MNILATIDMGFTQSTGDWELFTAEDGRRYISPEENYGKKDGKEVVIEYRIYLREDQIEPDPSGNPERLFHRGLLYYRDAIPVEI